MNKILLSHNGYEIHLEAHMTSLFSRKGEPNFLQLLIQSAENALHGAQLFRQAMMGTKPPIEYVQIIKDIEHKGDHITHEIFRGMSTVFITPLDREDIMELASKLDDVIDGIEATIARFDYLNVHFVDSYMKEFSLVIVSSCEHILEAFKLLSKKKYIQIMEHTVAINSLENEGDRLMRESIREIFTKKRDVYQDFQLKEIYERLEQTTDACEDVANILESVTLRYS
jgi:predicted phosphate transport protein (TIGR00153 family)